MTAPSPEPPKDGGRSFWEGHRERVRIFSNDLRARGVRMHWAAPPLYRLLWLLRIPAKPPLFQSFVGIFATMGSSFCLLWGAMMQLLSSAFPPPSALQPFRTGFVWTAAVAAGAFVGLVMAAVTRRKARQLALPPWDRYPAESVAELFR